MCGAAAGENAEFTRVLAKALHRPALFPAPAFALRLALGEMADALLLSSQRVAPQKLQQAGFRFAHADLTTAIGAVCVRAKMAESYFCTLMVTETRRVWPLCGSVDKRLSEVCRL